MKTISLRLSDRLHAQIEREAERRRCSKAEVVRAAVEQDLGQGEHKDREGQTARLTVAELAGDLLGSLDGPPDLSTNPKYMERFGE